METIGRISTRFEAWGRWGLLAALGLSLTACASRAPNTDLFGRPLTPGDSARPASLPPPPVDAGMDSDLPPAGTGPGGMPPGLFGPAGI